MASFTNMATLSYNGSQINSNVVTGELRDALTITKTAVSGGYRPGDTVTYVVTLSNTGTAALTGLTLTDDLGGSTVAAGTVYPLAYVPGSVLYYNGGTAQPAPTVTAGPPMTVTGVTVPAGGNATLVYQARATELDAAVAARLLGHGRHGGPAGAGADHQQGPVSRRGHRQRTPDLYLYHPQHRQHRPDRPGGGRDHRHLRPHPEHHRRHLQRHGLDVAGGLHL